MTDAVFDTEKNFDSFVKKYGGVLIKETIPKNPPFNNADYLFPDQKVVAELKCLQKDKLSDPDFIEKVKACWSKWHRAGKLPEAFSIEIHKDQMPPECYSDFRKLFIAQLQRDIKKANKQIRETKAALHLDGYKGLLLLANDFDKSIPPETLIRSVFEILNGDYSQINDYVLFTTNILTRIPGKPLPSYIWVSGCFANTDPIPNVFIDDLRIKWMSFHEAFLGITFKPSGSSETQKIYI